MAETGDPAKLPAIAQNNTQAAAALAASIGRARLLVVEDNMVNRKVLQYLLSKAPQCRADFVLMDVQMPEMDGLAATRWIRSLANREKANVPILALTANAMKGDREAYLAAGMTDYVSKPIDPAQLFAAIQRAIGGDDIDDEILRSLAIAERPSTPTAQKVEDVSGGDASPDATSKRVGGVQ